VQETSAIWTLPVTSMISRLAALLSLALLAACGAPTDVTESTSESVPGYEAVQDGEFFIPQVDKRFLRGNQAREEVDYAGDEDPASIVVDTFARKLYFILEGNRAMRYSVAVGREGLRFSGTGVIGRKAEWPSWQPTNNMIRTRPDLYEEYAGGLPGGLENPLGARAMYLYRGGRDTYFRIHGTLDDASIGHATSAGCIRLYNQDSIDLYERVDTGAKVKVRSLEESLAAEGPYIDDANGRAVPDTEENRALIEAETIAIAKANEAAAELAQKEADLAAKEAERALKKRLADCKRRGIDEADCPAPEDPTSILTALN
jgi:lipoprotein-anchoring transpeptidase ErfK/SrfK